MRAVECGRSRKGLATNDGQARRLGPGPRGVSDVKRPLAVLLIVLATTFALVRGAGAAGPLSEEDQRHYKAAFDAAGRGAWIQAEHFAERGKAPLPKKILRWLEISDGVPGIPFAEIRRFIAANPDWPRQGLLARRLEEAMDDTVPDAAVLDWFHNRAPRTVAGMTRLAAAYDHAGKHETADALVRRAWIEGDFAPSDERSFYKVYHDRLSQADNWARLDRLLWDGKEVQARRMLLRVDAGHQRLAEARMHLRLADASVDWAIRRMPKALMEDPGFLYERERWRRRKGRDDEAMEIFHHMPPVLVRPGLWWDERAAMARRRLADGAITDAYRLAKDHGPITGARLAEAEFLAGWIALRFLHDDKVALGHFATMYDNVHTPVSRARAAYWAGRAADAAHHQAKEARDWYRRAAGHDWTFYGQLAALRAGIQPEAATPPAPVPSARDQAAFDRNEMAMAARDMSTIGRDDLVRSFILRLGQTAKTETGRILAGRLAAALGRRDLGVVMARDAYRDGVQLPELAYPVISHLPRGGPEPALVHAVMRQESNFDVGAESRAGARGLMQIIPATARAIAHALKIAYVPDRLLSDGHYNLQLGQAFLDDLIGRYDGSYILALAAYNAGQGSVARWIKLNGDPRRPDVDAIDWIEQIPYDETRNYVERVLENLQVYRRRIEGDPGPAGPTTIEADLRRGTGPKG